MAILQLSQLLFDFLHDAVSEGLQRKTDEECLELATSIRVVLTELAERISNALEDDQELKQALDRISNRNKQR
jgi:hypothetical protein